MATPEQCAALKRRWRELESEAGEAKRAYKKACQEFWMQNLGLVPGETVVILRDDTRMMFRSIADRQIAEPGDKRVPWAMVSPFEKDGVPSKSKVSSHSAWRKE